VVADRSQRLPGDAQDERGHGESDRRVRSFEAECDDSSGGDDPQRDAAIDACVVSVCDECCAVEPPPGVNTNAGSEFIPEESDYARDCERDQEVKVAWVDQPIDRLVSGNARGDEDRCHDVSGPAFGSLAAEDERDAERNRRECIADVVHQVGE
jgi:hypothetical protein